LCALQRNVCLALCVAVYVAGCVAGSVEVYVAVCVVVCAAARCAVSVMDLFAATDSAVAATRQMRRVCVAAKRVY